MRTVLVTSGGGLQGMAVIQALRQVPQTRIVMVDCFAENIGRYHVTRFIRSPLLAREAEFVDFLESVCRDEDVDMVLPATALELNLLSRQRARLETTGAAVMVSSPQVLAIGLDKLQLHDWLLDLGLPVLPTTRQPSDRPEDLPLLGKPRSGWGGRGRIEIRTPDELQHWLGRPNDDMAWQPLLESFSEVSIDFAIDLDGHVSPLSVRCRLRTLAGFALIGQPLDEEPLRDMAQRVADELAVLGGRGLFNLQLLSTMDGTWVSDLNPRVGTSMPLSLAAGHNPVAFLLGVVSHPTGHTLPVRTFRAFREQPVYDLQLKDVRAVVFDLDDTLLDHKDWIARKLEGVWQQFQSRLPARSAFMRAALWLLEEGRRADLLDAVCAELRLDASLGPALIDGFRSYRPEACRLHPDVQPCLFELRKRGFQLALLSDNPAASQQMKISVAGLDDLVDAVILTAELGCRKPDRRGFDATSQALGIPPARAVMVGDNLYRDACGALDAGWAHAFMIHRPGGMFDFAEHLHGPLAQHLRMSRIHDLTELLWYLE